MDCSEVVNRLVSVGFTLVYGPAAVGKTNLVLQLLVDTCRRGSLSCLYATSEGLVSVNRLLQLGGGNIVVHEVIDLVDLLGLVEYVGRNIDRIGLVVVDSINAPYRVDALREGSSELFGYIVSALHGFAEEGVPVISTAQVHEVDGGVEAVGVSVLDLWAHRVVRVERSGDAGTRRAIIERGFSGETGVVIEFSIGRGGVVWQRCYRGGRQ